MLILIHRPTFITTIVNIQDSFLMNKNMAEDYCKFLMDLFLWDILKRICLMGLVLFYMPMEKNIKVKLKMDLDMGMVLIIIMIYLSIQVILLII